MEKIYISDAGPEVSAAIYGFWRWDSVNVNAKKVEDIINYNLELGVNTFDHSNQYGNGRIEEFFGKAIQARSFKREDIVISAKSGIRTDTGRIRVIDHSAENIRVSVEASLEKLKTDYIDIFLLEEHDPLFNVEETASALTELVLSGKIRFIGVSNFSVSQHRLLAAHLSQPIITNHIELNLLQTSALQDGRLDFIREQYSKPLAWAPLAGGQILNGKSAKALKVRKALQQVSKSYTGNIEQTAVAWLYKLGALPIIGSPDKKRIRNAATAYSINLSRDDWYQLYNASR